ncbi:MAG TPA: hypothetical protein ENH20_00585 [Candidatus Pacearchaeota archaeon]|nr:hypothetical protein [Candidatus Pacearchaeota archaeon]
MELNKDSEVKSITIVKGSSISPAERIARKIGKEDFLEIMVVKNSPLRMITREIKGTQKPTDGFRDAISNAGLLNKKFNFYK